MNLDELRPILTGYRAKAQAAWSPATAHPDYEGKAGDPAGQCGVTSAWLQRRLTEDHGVETVYVVGILHVAPNGGSVEHCWLDLDAITGSVVIDLTADQWSSLKDRPVICEAWDSLFWGGTDYTPRRHLTAKQLAADPVQPRLALLEAAVS